MATFGGKKYYEIARGDTGVVYRAVTAQNPDNTVIKHPVSNHEFEMAQFWADKNSNEEDNYSAGPIKMVELEYESGKKVKGMQMTYLGDKTYEDCSHKLSLGETVLLYLMLVHCTLRLAGIALCDTAWHNCMCQGAEQDFRIALVDTYEWERKTMESYIIENFQYICFFFKLDLNPFLEKINPFMRMQFKCERAFLTAMFNSCEELTDDFLYNNERVYDGREHYHERIDNLLNAIKKDMKKVIFQLQAFDALETSSITAAKV